MTFFPYKKRPFLHNFTTTRNLFFLSAILSTKPETRRREKHRKKSARCTKRHNDLKPTTKEFQLLCQVRVKSSWSRAETRFQHHKDTWKEGGKKKRAKEVRGERISTACWWLLAGVGDISLMIWNRGKIMVCICFSPNRSILSAYFCISFSSSSSGPSQVS